MAKATKLSSETVQRAYQQVETAQTAEEMKRALAVILPFEFGATQVRVAQALGIGLATVKRYQAGMFREAHKKGPQRRRRGGRRNETISLETERAFLSEWAQKASEGGVVVVGQLREALQRRVGARIPLYTMYRILARHGWRKVAPDTRHPKSDPRAQEAYKKNSRGWWLPPSEQIENV
jgi:transposase